MIDKVIDEQRYLSFVLFLERACGIALGDNKQYLVRSRLSSLTVRYDFESINSFIDAVLSGTVATAKSAAAMVEDDTVDFTPPASTPTPEPQTAPFVASSDNDDDAMSYFEKLANE